MNTRISLVTTWISVLYTSPNGTGRSLDGSERNPMYGKIETLRDVVMFFHRQPLLGAAQVRQQR